MRCKRNGNQFCIQRMGEEMEYHAAGVGGEVLRERVEELLEGRERGVRWVLPVASKRDREGLKPVRWQWEGVRDG